MKTTIRITLAALLLSLVACQNDKPQPPVKASSGKGYVPQGK